MLYKSVIRPYYPLLIISLMIYTACLTEDEGPRLFTRSQTKRLLDGDSAKVWGILDRFENGNRVMLEDCKLDELLTFTDADYLSITSNKIICNEQEDSILFLAEWDVIRPEERLGADSIILVFPVDTVAINDSVSVIITDTIFWIIEDLTSQLLTLSFDEFNSDSTLVISVTEEYENLP